MSRELNEIRALLIQNASGSNRQFIEKAVPGNHFAFGVKTPVLNSIASNYKTGSFELSEELWNAGSLEEKIIAIKIIEKTGKQDPARLFRLFEKFSRSIDNWAVCDGLGMQFLHPVRATHADKIFSIAGKFVNSADKWKRRLSLVMVEWYTRDKKHHAPIKALLKKLENDEEYYVKKAIAWINRNLKKGK